MTCFSIKNVSIPSIHKDRFSCLQIFMLFLIQVLSRVEVILVEFCLVLNAQRDQCVSVALVSFTSKVGQPKVAEILTLHFKTQGLNFFSPVLLRPLMLNVRNVLLTGLEVHYHQSKRTPQLRMLSLLQKQTAWELVYLIVLKHHFSGLTLTGHAWITSFTSHSISDPFLFCPLKTLFFIKNLLLFHFFFFLTEVLSYIFVLSLLAYTAASFLHLPIQLIFSL